MRGARLLVQTLWNRHSLLIFLVPFDLQWHQHVFTLLAARQHEALAWCFHKNPEAKQAHLVKKIHQESPLYEYRTS